MKNILKNAIIKKILIVFSIIVMVTSFIVPNYSYAATVPQKLVSSIFYLLSYVGDTAMSLMQDIMLGDSNLKSDGKWSIKYSPGMIFANQVAGLKINFITAKSTDGTSTNLTVNPSTSSDVKNILYRMAAAINKYKSDGIPADGEVVGHFDSDGNWNSYGDDGTSLEEDTGMIAEDDSSAYKYKMRKYLPQNIPHLYIEGAAYNNWVGIDDEKAVPIIYNNAGMNEAFYMYCYNGYLYVGHCDDEAFTIEKDGDFEDVHKGGDVEYVQIKDMSNVIRYPLSFIENESVEKDSIAYKLQGNIAQWYVALRNIALVGLLSVLLYIGIQIVLKSTSAQDKAKYKNMMKDWLVAICILFVLHYLMAFMTTFTEDLTSFINTNFLKIDADGNVNDGLISTVRSLYEESAEEGETPKDTAGYTVMYLALVILTGTFTIQYLKRVIFMAFLTIIAPMIALTYPLDKIKDGKAQAFSYWLREYIFNCLIQPVHLLLYVVFIGNAIDFAIDNMLYAIVALAFMVPAEKFIKDMFGMKSQSPTGTLSAAAGGAMVMNMVNKLRGKGPKGDAGKAGAGASSNPNGIRTATRSSSSGGGSGSRGDSGADSGSSPRDRSSLGGDSNSRDAQDQGRQQAQETAQDSGGGSRPHGNSGGDSNSRDTQAQGRQQAQETAQDSGDGSKPHGNSDSRQGSNSKRRSGSIAGGIFKGLGKRYIYGPSALKSNVGRLTGVVGAGLGATVGLAAGVASGDLGKAAQYAGAGALAGYHGGNNLAQNAIQGVTNMPTHARNIRDAWREGYYTTEEYYNKKFDDKFYKSDGYKMIEEDDKLVEAYGGEAGIKAATQQFLDNGITDATQIRKAMQSGISGDDYKAYTKRGLSDVKEMKKLNDAQIDVSTYSEFADMGIKDANRIINAQKALGKDSSGNARDSKTIASLVKLAQSAPKDKAKFMNFATNMKINGKNVSEEEAEEIYSNLINIL